MDQHLTNIPEKTNSSLLDDMALRQLPADNPGMVCIIRVPEMKVFFVNEQFHRYLGYQNTDLGGAGVYFNQLMEQDQQDHLENQLGYVSDSIEARSSFVIYRLKSKKGKVIPFYVYAAPFMADNNPHGKLFFLLLNPDLSKMGMPFTSFDSKELFLEQFGGENFGTFEWIMEVDKIFCSAGIHHIYEIENEKQGGISFFITDMVHPDDKERVLNATKHALDSGDDLNIEYRIITGKNHIKLIHSLARSVKNNSGKLIKFAGSVRDITEQRGIETSLKDKVEELNHSNKELEEFAYVASHDMQEPLRKITTFSDRLSEKYKDALTGEGAMYLSRIIASAENMRNLINDLLDFSRIAKNEQPFESVNLHLVLRQVKLELELVIEETGTVIDMPKMPVIEAIPSQMKQLFANIISNAIKFRKPDISPVITITVEELAENDQVRYGLPQAGPYYKIVVADNGIGFEEEYATRIFQVFQRLHGKSEYPGSGIGLAICKKILEYHQGSIFAEGTPDVGARFVMLLPLHQQLVKENNL